MFPSFAARPLLAALVLVPAVSASPALAVDDLLWFQADGAQANWASSGLQFRNARPFASWLADPTDTVLPAFDARLSLNCWEFVYYSALRRGRIRKAELAPLAARADANGDAFRATILPHGRQEIRYAVEGVGARPRVTFAPGPRPRAGDVVLFDGWSHVTQATGRLVDGRMEIVSFAPRPIWGDGQMTWGVADVAPEVTTVESLIENLVDLYPDVPTDWDGIRIEFGPPAWERAPVPAPAQAPVRVPASPR